MFRLDLPYLLALFGIPQRVSFLGGTGPDNEGTLIAVKPCRTWGQMAEVLWDSGEQSHVRNGDLKYL
jgi:hypothetical protein